MVKSLRTAEEARELAEPYARKLLEGFLRAEPSFRYLAEDTKATLLAAEYIEEEFSYFFFLNDHLRERVPMDRVHTGQYGYAVAKEIGYKQMYEGRVLSEDPIRGFFDLRAEPERMKQYCREFSDLMGKHKI